MRRGIFRSMRMEAGEEKGGWETGFLFLDFYGYRENGLVAGAGTHTR